MGGVVQVDEITDCDKCVTNSGDTPLTKRSKLCDDLPKEIEPVSASTNRCSHGNNIDYYCLCCILFVVVPKTTRN